MAGRIYLRNKTYWIAFSHKGTEYRHSAKTNKKREAENVLAFYLGKCARGEFKGFEPETKPYTMAEMFDDLVSDCERRQVKSIETMKRRLKPLYKAFGSLVAEDLTERHIDLFVKKRFEEQFLPATVKAEMQYLGQAFRTAKRKRLMQDIPAIPSIPVHNVRQGFFETEAFEKIVACLPDDLKDVARFGYYTGWRKGEVTALEWRFIEEDILRLPPTLSKNKDGRVLVLTGELAEIIERRRQARYELSPWVFHREGKKIRSFRNAWDKACARAGVKRYFHDFRRTAVRNLTRAGVPEKISMSITGHKTRSVFDRYNIVNEEDIREGLDKTFARLKERRIAPLFSANVGQISHT